MPSILTKRELAPKIVSFVVDAPRIARRAKPGQFVVVRLSETSERIPLTIADFDENLGIITLVVQAVGKSTIEMAAMQEGDSIVDLLGPLGTPFDLRESGWVVCVAGGLGAAPIYPKAKALREAGCQIVTILGAQTRELLIYEEELGALSEKTIICTNDGSAGYKGFVTGPLKEYLDGGEPVDEIIAVGPIPMMSAVCDLTSGYNIPTVVSLNSIMIDGTGMCGGCRVTVGGEVKFTCVDGPAFDGHKVDFKEMSDRQRFYKNHEETSLHHCRIGLGGV